MPRRPRVLLLIALGAVTLLLSGCVYLRLLQLKLQLGDFEKNFAVDTRDGLVLTFKHPVLLDEDVEKFFHWVPDGRQHSGTAEKWHFAWIKVPAPDEAGQSPVEISLDLFFSEGKLTRMVMPEKFFAAILPKSLALAGLRSLGGAKVDKEKRRAESTISSDDLKDAATDKFLTLPGLLDALGQPTTPPTAKGELEVWRYQFTPFSKKQRFGDNGAVEVTFTLNPVTGKVNVMDGKTMFGRIVFDTTNVGPGATGTMNTALPK